ncbi:protein lifeguard 1-like [Spea bombifrons]|uniref:protein lifeguard 1-like n=1 Tax=Spea bombifrons TaxID=233779 RepID=UPI0023497073|nr:protein lifeguard 1-like [Spea bombifrons]XP_053322606.1 protein lifeguard 1-like [Spea bombifrons]
MSPAICLIHSPPTFIQHTLHQTQTISHRITLQLRCICPLHPCTANRIRFCQALTHLMLNHNKPSLLQTMIPKLDVEGEPPEYTSGMGDSSPFSEKAIRRAFIRKVYITLAIQLTITVGIICMFIFWETLKEWVQDTPYFAYALLPAVLILIMVLLCCENARRKVPFNFILLGIFTIVEGCMLGAISALYDVDAVMWAGGATVVVTLGLTLFALQSKWDFTIMSGGLCCALLVLLCFGMLCAILRSFWLNIVYACIGTFIFGMYLVVDTQLILGGKHRYSVSPEEYIFAALNIYLDIVNLFLLLLQLFGLCR